MYFKFGNTQKGITTSGTNFYKKHIDDRKSRLRNGNLKQIYNSHLTKENCSAKKRGQEKTGPTEKQKSLSTSLQFSFRLFFGYNRHKNPILY